MSIPRFCFDPAHPGMDLLRDADEFDPAELRALVNAHGKAVRVREPQGTARHAALMAAGGEVYQTCQAQSVDATTPEVRRWAKNHDILATVSGERFDVVDAYLRLCQVNHEGWNPAGPYDVLREAIAPMIEAELDVKRSRFVSFDGQIVAAAFVFPADGYDEVGVEALLPDNEFARDAVASCMAKVLMMADGIVHFDGHVNDPHVAPLLNTLPGVFAADGMPLDLIRIRPEA